MPREYAADRDKPFDEVRTNAPSGRRARGGTTARTDDSPVPHYPDLLRLDGRGAVVIGAGQGIGRQAAHALASAGARVVCVDLEPERAHDVAEEVGGIPWVGDARDRPSVERMAADATAALGRVDSVVDIVGMSRYETLLDTDDESWAWHHDTVLRHAWLAIQAFGRPMAESGGGTVAIVASVSGLTGAPLHAAYGAAKAGLMSLVRSAAVELGPAGIRVNAVAPGVVATPRVAALLTDRDKPPMPPMPPSVAWPSRLTSPAPCSSCRATWPPT